MRTKPIPNAFTAYSPAKMSAVFLNISDRGKGKDGNAFWYYDSKSGDKTFKPIIKEVGNLQYAFVDDVDGKFMMSTNDGAKNRRIIFIDPQNPDPSKWETVVP